jgi:hypothetical protein
LLADARYLVARPGLHRRAAFWTAIAVPIAAYAVWPRATIGLWAAVAATLVARGPTWKKALAIGGASLALFYARRVGPLADVLVAQLHNLVAVGLWWAWTPRRTKLHWPALALFALGALLTLSGRADALVWTFGGQSAPASGLDLGRLVPLLSPTSDPIWALRLVLFFAFAQSVHYAVWLRLIPEDDRPRPGLRSFTSSVRAIIADVGAPLFVFLAIAAAVLAAWSLSDVRAARDGYLRVAGFHAYLELAVALLFFVEGRFPLRRA